MPANFSSPSILFLAASHPRDRAFVRPLLAKLHARGYTRYVEPFCGEFAMALEALDAGFEPSAIETSDVGLYPTICGYLFSGGDLRELGVAVDGELLELPEEPALAGATIAYTQLLLRMQAKPKVDYWLELVRDLEERREPHILTIAERLGALQKRLGGIQYRLVDGFTHMKEAADDERTVIFADPPTYLGGYERMANTGGRLTWAEPEYQLFDPDVHVRELLERSADREALLLVGEDKAPGGYSHPRPVYARHVAAGQYVYICSNRPDEVFELTGGPRVVPRASETLEPAPRPVIPLDYEIADDARLELLPLSSAAVGYYRELWLHRVKADTGAAAGTSYTAAVLVDGYVAGIIGLSPSPITNPYPGARQVRDAILIRFAVGAPHKSLRLARLATLMALQRRTLLALVQPQTRYLAEIADRVVTVEMTRHPEAKGLRGLMKLERRARKGGIWHLTYAAPMGGLSNEEVLSTWLRAEQRWQSRSKKTAAASR